MNAKMLVFVIRWRTKLELNFLAFLCSNLMLCLQLKLPSIAEKDRLMKRIVPNDIKRNLIKALNKVIKKVPRLIRKKLT